MQRLDLLFCVGVARGLVVLQVAGLLRGPAGDHDLRQVVLGLDQVELRLVRRIVGVDLRVGDVDLRLDLLVQQLGLGQRAAQFALQVVEGEVARLELLVELLLRVGRLHLRQLGVHVLVAGGQVELGGALPENLVLDHLAQDIEADNVGLLGGGLLGIVAQVGLVILLQLRAQNILAIYGRHHVRRGRAVTPAHGGNQGYPTKNEDGQAERRCGKKL